jgi:hypothetical protein
MANLGKVGIVSELGDGGRVTDVNTLALGE